MLHQRQRQWQRRGRACELAEGWRVRRRGKIVEGEEDGEGKGRKQLKDERSKRARQLKREIEVISDREGETKKDRGKDRTRSQLPFFDIFDLIFNPLILLHILYPLMMPSIQSLSKTDSL